jgi:(1->4)-alpha-D-glucan 1-alpha-D-glucosylmutase
MNIPSATYRIQFNKHFTFSDLDRILDYLHQLGVSTIYAAPIFESTPGSTHGYDVTNPQHINPDIGTYDELKMLAGKLKEKGMTWLQDIVPNHMAFTAGNTRLMDVLERGALSEYYTYFDINWEHPVAAFRNRVMAPFLGDDLDTCIRKGDIQLVYSDKGFTINYFDAWYPLSLPAYDYIATQLDPRGHGSDALYECIKLIPGAATAKNLAEWQQYKKDYIYPALDNADKQDPVNARMAIFNKDAGKMKELLARQHYVLTSYKAVNEEINYRRFFTVNSLICLRMENEAVFDDYHTLTGQLYNEGIIQGVRIDHIDGLHDPTQYIARLRRLLGDDCYIIAEKILGEKEVLPGRWLLQGTTGYEFLSFTSQLLTDRQQSEQLENFYRTLLPAMPAYEKVVANNKQQILHRYMRGEWKNLLHYFFELNLHHGMEAAKLQDALAAIMICLPVYRIYPERLPLEAPEALVLQEMFTKARAYCEACIQELDYLQNLFTGPLGDAYQQQRVTRFLQRLMQFTGPLTAKGVEDTTFYVYNPLIAHNEVGDSPATLGIPVADFHRKMIDRQQATPLSLNATATHDTKRGEDARLRINVLSEMPGAWQQQVQEWRQLNAPLRTLLNEQPAPDLNDEYFIYQSLVGGFPADRVVTDDYIQRLQAYLVKALREAKVHTRWEEPDEAYEQACRLFIERLLSKEHAFVAVFLPFLLQVGKYAAVYSSGQALIKITAPGIPDIYQGCELWDLSYVDPDNRRPVDYSSGINYLQQLITKEKEGIDQLVAFLQSHQAAGVEKLFITWKALQFRKAHHTLFTGGQYHPLTITSGVTTAVGYARQLHDRWVLVVVSLNLVNRENDGEDNYLLLPPGAPQKWVNIFTGEHMSGNGQLALQQVFARFSVAMLSS